MLFGFGCLSRPKIEISDISADISAIYRIPEYNEAIFAIENRLDEKSKKNREMSAIFRQYIGIGPKFRRNFGE